jgi:hypothetical protein
MTDKELDLETLTKAYERFSALMAKQRCKLPITIISGIRLAYFKELHQRLNLDNKWPEYLLDADFGIYCPRKKKSECEITLNEVTITKDCGKSYEDVKNDLSKIIRLMV